MDKRDIGIGLVGLVGIAYVVSNGVMLADFVKGKKNKISEGESFEADETVCLMCGDYKDPKQTYCCADCSRYAIRSINPLGGKRGGPPRGDIAKAVLTLKEYGGEMSANQWRARIKDIRPTIKELSNKGISLLVQYLNPDVYIKRQGRQNTYQIISGNCYDDWAKERYQAESFDAELKRDSCCCGATVETPCLCMVEGVMNCSAVEPKCPCYAAKDAESFEAEYFIGKEGYFIGSERERKALGKEMIIESEDLKNFGEPDWKYIEMAGKALVKGDFKALRHNMQMLDSTPAYLITEIYGDEFEKVISPKKIKQLYLKLDAESFEAERKPNQCMHCNEVLYEIEVWEDFRCPHCNNSIGDIYSDEISYDDYMSAESFEAEVKEKDIKELAQSFDDDEGLPYNTYESTYMLIGDGIDWETANDWANSIKAQDERYYLKRPYRFNAESFGAEEGGEKLYKDKMTKEEMRKYINWLWETDTQVEHDNQGQVMIYTGYKELWTKDSNDKWKFDGYVLMDYCPKCEKIHPDLLYWENQGLPHPMCLESSFVKDNEAESFEAPGEMEEEDFTPMDITQCHVCARQYEYSRIARALVQHYLKESKDGTLGWKNKSNPDGTRRTVRNIAGYQLYWFGLGALENYLEEGKISKMTPMVIELLRTAIVPNIIAGDVVQFIESMEIDDIEDTDPKFFTDFSDTWEAPDDRLKPERPSDDSGDRSKYRKKPRKPWRAENEPSE